MWTTEVENFPGFPEGIEGPELMTMMRKQAQRFGAKIITDQAISVDFSKKNFTVKTAQENYSAPAIIIATGASAMWLNVPGEQEYRGRGVSACATCDGFFFKGKEVVVVGGGDAAMEEANFLSKFATKITVAVRRDDLKASKIMQERVKANPKVSFLWNTEAKEVLGDGKKVTGVRLMNNKTGMESALKTDGVFVAIGHKPNTEIFAGQIEMDLKGYVVVDARSSKTSVEGVFAAGDVVDHVYRQAVTAAGSGCVAAIDAERYLANQE